MNAQESKYNGWKNYETWNVALWIQNDEDNYNIARRSGDYAAFVAKLAGYGEFITPDGVAWNDPSLDIKALDELLRDL